MPNDNAATANRPSPQASVVGADGIRLHVSDVGDGPPVVLMHGGGPGASCAGNFAGNVPALAEHHRVLGVDLPGYGASDKPEYDGLYIPAAAKAVTAALDALGVGTVNLIGNSLGGGVAVQMALDAPDRVRRMVLIGAAGAARSVLTPSPSEGIKHLTGYYAGSGPSRQKMEDFQRVMVFDQSRVTPETIEERFAASVDPERRTGVERVYAGLAGGATVAGEQMWQRLGSIECPVLLVWGREDRILPLDGGIFMLSQIPDAQLHVFPHCGHWAQLEHQDAFNQLVLNFLNEGESR